MIHAGTMFCGAEVLLALVVVSHRTWHVAHLCVAAAYQVTHQLDRRGARVVVAAVYAAVEAIFVGHGVMARLIPSQQPSPPVSL